MKERKDRVEDDERNPAVVEEVFCPAAARPYATRVLDGMEGENADQTAGVAIVRRAPQAPLRQIAANAGVEGSIIVGKLLEGGNESRVNAQTEEYVDMIATGIVDPTKVVRTALTDASFCSAADHHRGHGLRRAGQGRIAGGMPGGMPDMGGMM